MQLRRGGEKTFQTDMRRERAMIADLGNERGSKVSGTAVDGDIQTVAVTVTAGAPGDPPTFAFDPQDIEILQPQVTLALTLDQAGFSSVTFAPFGATDPGPIVWRKPGTKEPVARPSYIAPPTLDASATTLSFDVTNTASGPKMVLVSFTIRILADGQIYESPDPTIINVDPT
jgi:DP-EP family